MKLSTKDQIKRIKLIMGHPAMITCFECGKTYLPMGKETRIYCPFCMKDDIINFDEPIEPVYEEVSFEESEF